MAARNSAGRGRSATATKSRSSSGSKIAASDISQLTVNDIRGELRKRGIAGIWGLRKPELVKRLTNAMRAEGRRGGAAKTAPGGRGGASRGGTTRGPAKSARTSPAKKSAAARKSAGAKKSAAAAKKSPAPARKSPAPAKKSAARTSTSAKSAPDTAGRAAATTRKPAGGRAGGARTGSASARSVKYAQEITSPQERPERPGRSLVTTDHEVIKRWARDRNASPATIEGTEREGRLGVLTFDFPGWRSGGRLRQVSWTDWFTTFDLRRLNFIYQEQKTDGRQSNFFRVESPDREDA